MVNETGNEVATVTQPPEQNPAIGNAGNEAGARAEAATQNQWIAMLADSYDPKKPFKFTKLEIKDGFW